MTHFFSQCTEKEKMSHLDPKTWVTAELKFDPTFLSQNDNFLLSAHREIIESCLTLKVESLAELKIWSNFFRSKGLNFSLSASIEKLSHFDLKKLSLAELKFVLKNRVTGGIIIRPGKVSNWRIFESIELSKLSQFDSQCWFNSTLNVEPIILSMLSQFDSQCWVN